jgi:transketolase
VQHGITDDGTIDFPLSDDIVERFPVSHWHMQEVDG